MSFSLEHALANANSVISQREAKKKEKMAKKITYVLYFSNNEKQPEGQIKGFTIQQLKEEFRAHKGSYKYAFITKIGDDKVLRFYSSAMGKKFFSLTRTGKKS